MESTPGSPCVAMSQVAAMAATSPTNSRPRGSFRANTQENSMTNAMPVLCSTVAVPAFVYPITTAYVIWHKNSPTAPNTTRRAAELRSCSIAASWARLRTASTSRNSTPAPSMRTAVTNEGVMS